MTERDREGLSFFLFTDTKDSYLAHFLSTSESENSAPPDRWPPSRSPTHPSRLKKGRFSAPEVPGPIPWPVLGPCWAGAAGRNDTADRSAAVVRRRPPPAKAKGPPHRQMRGGWGRLQRNTTTFGEGGFTPHRLKPGLGPKKGRFTRANPDRQQDRRSRVSARGTSTPLAGA